MSGEKKLAKTKNPVRPIETAKEEKIVTDVRKIGPMFEEKPIEDQRSQKQPKRQQRLLRLLIIHKNNLKHFKNRVRLLTKRFRHLKKKWLQSVIKSTS